MSQKNYLILFTVAFLSISAMPFLLPYGGLVGDSHHYFRLAEEFPTIRWSLFPLGYPLLLRFFKTFTGDYFWSAWLINILCFAAIGIFSKVKNFFWKETVVLLCTKIFAYIYILSLPEPVYLTLMYFLFYSVYQIIDVSNYGRKHVLIGSLIFLLLFSVRYSTLYIYGAFWLFVLLSYLSKKLKTGITFRMIQMLILAGFLQGLYMFFNYSKFGDFMGEKFRNLPDLTYVNSIWMHQAFSIFNTYNPVTSIKLWELSQVKLGVEIFLMFVNIFFLVITWKSVIKANQIHLKDVSWFNLLLLTGNVYMLLMLIASYFQTIEALHVRTLCEASFCFFVVLTFLQIRNQKNEKLIFRLAAATLIFNVLYTVKTPGNFLAERAKVEKVLPQFANKKYFLDDSGGKAHVTEYKIPFTGNRLRHAHPTIQPGHIHGYMIYSLDPQIEMILSDSAVVKEEILYHSELEKTLKKSSKE